MAIKQKQQLKTKIMKTNTTKKMKTKSFKSPKNKYRASVTYSKALKGIGSVTSATANEIDVLKSHIQFYIDQAHRNKATCFITISENLKQYPFFDWKEIKKYTN